MVKEVTRSQIAEMAGGNQELILALERVFAGSYQMRSVNASGAIGIGDQVVLADATSGAITLNLPRANTVAGRSLYVKKIDATGNQVVLDGDQAELIDGIATFALVAQHEVVKIFSDGKNWHII